MKRRGLESAPGNLGSEIVRFRTMRAIGHANPVQAGCRLRQGCIRALSVSTMDEHTDAPFHLPTAIAVACMKGMARPMLSQS